MDLQRKITLTLPWQTVQIISAAVQELPFRVASPVLAEMQKQITDQTADNVVPLNSDATKDSAA